MNGYTKSEVGESPHIRATTDQADLLGNGPGGYGSENETLAQKAIRVEAANVRARHLTSPGPIVTSRHDHGIEIGEAIFEFAQASGACDMEYPGVNSKGED